MTEQHTPRTIAVIDGNSLMHRAFHAVDAPMTAPSGEPTNAVFGFMSMFIKLVSDYKPDGVICAFDLGRPKFRMEALERYKAQRPPMDEGLRVQFPMIEALLASMNIPVVKIREWEGDDILGTYARLGEEQGDKVLLVTGDKDAFQLASETTRIVSTKRGMTDVVIYGPAEVEERYGVTPAQVPDYLGLKGDSSDNIPGVPGVGEKTAAKLLQQYGSIDGIYEHADEIKGKLGERVRGNEDAARVSKLVATIKRDAPVEVAIDEAVWPSFDANEVRRAFGELRFKAHLDKILALAAASGDEAAGAAAAAGEGFGSAESDAAVVVEPVLEGDEAVALVDAAIKAGEWVGAGLAADAGADEPDELFPLDDEEPASGEVLYVATSKAVARITGDAVASTLVRVVREGRLCAHDAKELLGHIVPRDTALPAAIAVSEVDPERLFDASVAAYLLMSNFSSYPMATLLPEYLDATVPEGDDAPDPALVDAAGALALREPLIERLKAENAIECFNQIELPLVPVLLGMERTGTAVDLDVLRKLSAGTAGQIDELKQQIFELAGEEFNIDSPKQLGTILFDKLGLDTTGIKKNKNGYSTDAKVLEKLKNRLGEGSLPEKVLKYRELAKMKSTYLDALPRIAEEYGDKRLHTSFNQTITATGRLSSSNPNLQNIPVRTDFGRKVREAFKPDEPGWVFVSADYSQIELRLLAHLSGDEGLIAAFKSGEDFHRATAARVFGIDPADVTPEMRSRAKAVNFGIVYGQQAFGLGQSLHIPMREAQEMIDRYYEAYPQVRTYLDQTVLDAKETGYAETVFGRRRHIPELSNRNPNLRAFGERTAMNHPMQGSAADVIKLAMIEVARRMHEEGLAARLVLQVHDELDFECPADEVERLSELVSTTMSGIVDLRVPLDVDVSSGESWAQAH